MAENTDIRLTVEAWADIVVDNWLDKIIKLNIGSGQLGDGIKYEVLNNSGNIPERVSFEFAFYGKFVDMGVGKGLKLEDVPNARDMGYLRRPKTWYSKNMYSQVLKLRDILSKKYGHIAVLTIVELIGDSSIHFNQSNND